MPDTFPGLDVSLRKEVSELRPTSFSRLTAADGALLLLLSIFLFLLCAVRSGPRLLWGDELFGYRVLSASSIHAMLKGWWEGADGGGLLYYLLARLWTRLFGLSELTLRLFSTAGMCTGLALTWIAARRYFSAAVVALSVGFVYLTPAAMLWQELNGRFYGLFLASAAFASLMFLITAEDKITRGTLVLTAAAHGALISSHILGLVYSFGLIAGTVIFDLHRRRRRWPLYLAQLSGWFLVPVCFHAIRQSSSIAAGGFWTALPRLRDLLLGVAVYGKITIGLLAALALGVAVQRLLQRRNAGSLTPPPPVTALLGSLLLAQGLLFLKSQRGVSIYADRYLIPLSIGTVFLFALCLRTLSQAAVLRALPRRAQWAACMIALVCLCAYAVSSRVNYALYPSRGYPQRVTALIPPGAPILSNSLVFALLSTYDPLHRPLTLTNWHYGPPVDDHNDYSEQRLMANWKRAGYSPQNILTCREAFSEPGTLYLLIDPPQTAWFEQHIVRNSAYRSEQLATSTEWQFLTLWAIHRVSAGPPPC